ncbi:MAG: phosphonate C-P lyase system protein PhnH [Granulosicoccus sp.]|nr:phosphonate C-P lyase system protein PhnH [Granulosicoccus sp.]
MQAHALEGGFKEPAVDAAHAFRAVMEAMSRPGSIHLVAGARPPAPLSMAAGVCLLALCDHETGIFLAGSHDHLQVREWIGFHTGAPITDAATCQFALGTWESLPAMDHFPIGTAEYPDRSATVLVELQELTLNGATLSGPGIKDTVSLSLPELLAFQKNHRLYPLGLDFLFTQDDRLAALPRSTEVV